MNNKKHTNFDQICLDKNQTFTNNLTLISVKKRQSVYLCSMLGNQKKCKLHIRGITRIVIDLGFFLIAFSVKNENEIQVSIIFLHLVFFVSITILVSTPGVLFYFLYWYNKHVKIKYVCHLINN